MLFFAHCVMHHAYTQSNTFFQNSLIFAFKTYTHSQLEVAHNTRECVFCVLLGLQCMNHVTCAKINVFV